MRNEHFNPVAIEGYLQQMQAQLEERIRHFDSQSICMLGIHTGGYWIAQKLYQQMNLPNPLGSLSISFYRDDFTRVGLHPQVKPSQIPLDIEDKHIILVDDVLFSGRTVRAALNEIFDYGRPASVLFCCLVDRNAHELPICADVYGLQMQLPHDKHIKLNGPEPLSLSIIDSKSDKKIAGTSC